MSRADKISRPVLATGRDICFYEDGSRLLPCTPTFERGRIVALLAIFECVLIIGIGEGVAIERMAVLGHLREVLGISYIIW